MGDLLVELLDGHDHVHVDHVVEVPVDARELGDDVLADGRGDLDVVAGEPRKVDLQAAARETGLRLVAAAEAAGGARVTSNEIERKIKDICDAALERNIDVNDNLFEIGASSLKQIEIHELPGDEAVRYTQGPARLGRGDPRLRLLLC